MTDEGEHLLIAFIVGAVHLSPGANEKSLEDIDAVGVLVHNLGSLCHMCKDLIETSRFPFAGIAVPVVEEAHDQLSPGGSPCGKQFI